MAKTKKVTERKIISRCVYTITRDQFEDGKYGVSRVCDGFNAHELLGLLEMAQVDIINTITGKMPPAEYIKRQVIL